MLITHRVCVTNILNNKDFDGDAVGVQFILDDSLNKELSRHQPHYNVLSLNAPRNISNVMAIPKPVIAGINRWYHDNETTPGDMDRFLV